MAEQGKASITIPLLIDAGLLLLVVFQAGVIWSKVETVQGQVSALHQKIETTQSRDSMTGERLARIETGIDGIKEELERMREHLRRDGR